MLGLGVLVARYRRARWSRRRVERRLARYCARTTPLDDLWRAGCRASEAERVRFLAEIEDVPC